MISLIFAHQAISVFSELGTIIMIGLLLLIPVIVIESLILKNHSKKSWWKLLNFCVIISFIASLAAILLESFANNLPHGIVVLLCWVALLIIIIWIENIIYQKHWKVVRKGKLLLALIIINIISYIMLSAVIQSARQARYSQRLCCINNLKQIGLGLIMYANDYEGFLPEKSGAKGLNKLCPNYLGHHKLIFVCPSTTTKKGEPKQKLIEKNVDYIYRAGLKYSPVDGKDSSKIPVIWDKPTNHDNYGNVFFLDGHVKGFEGANWMEQAGIKETAPQQGK